MKRRFMTPSTAVVPDMMPNTRKAQPPIRLVEISHRHGDAVAHGSFNTFCIFAELVGCPYPLLCLSCYLIRV